MKRLYAGLAKVPNLRRVAILMTLVVLLLLILFAWTYAQSGGGYDLTWNIIGSGGGNNSVGDYTLNGTFGQPAAGVLSGGEYILVSGFQVGERAVYSFTVGPGLGGTLVSTDTRGLTTDVQVPVGAVTDTTELRFMPILSPTEPVSPQLRFGGHAFELDAYRNDQPLSGFTFETTVTVTIHYADADVAGIDEKTLKLRRWVPEIGWQVVGERLGEGQTLDTVNNVLTAWLCGLSKFGSLGVGTGVHIFLPIVIKSG